MMTVLQLINARTKIDPAQTPIRSHLVLYRKLHICEFGYTLSANVKYCMDVSVVLCLVSYRLSGSGPGQKLLLKFAEQVLRNNVMKRVEHLDFVEHFESLDRLARRGAGHRLRNHAPRRSTGRARDHRVLDRSTREKCS